MIAADSHRLKPVLVVIAGMRPGGLTARNAGSSLPPKSPPQSRRSTLTPASPAAHITRAVAEESLRPHTVIMVLLQ